MRACGKPAAQASSGEQALETKFTETGEDCCQPFHVRLRRKVQLARPERVPRPSRRPAWAALKSLQREFQTAEVRMVVVIESEGNIDDIPGRSCACCTRSAIRHPIAL